MRFKKIFLLISLIICISSITGVCANDTTMDGDGQFDFLQTNDVVEDNIQLSGQKQALMQTDNGKTIGEHGNDLDCASGNTKNGNSTVNVGSYTYLQNLIDNSTGNVVLDMDITFNPDYDLSPDNPYYGKINFTNGVLINKTLTIDGNAFTINGNDASRIFNITAENCVLENTNFINGRSPTYGGAIYSNAYNTTINYCNFTNNFGLDYGGAIYFEKMAIVNFCNFKSNQLGRYKVSKQNGGAIYFKDEANVVNSNFVNNSVNNNGGAIYFSLKTNLKNCNFDANTASGGGAAYFASQAIVDNCNFNANHARDCGAVYFKSFANVTNSNFTHNYATLNDGGAILFNIESYAINCTFINNSAKFGRGGAINFNVIGTVENCNFINNSADIRGGAVNFLSEGNLINSNFFNNTGSTGGAAYISGLANINHCNFIDNTAIQNAGAVLIGSSALINNSNFNGNKAKGGSAIQVLNAIIANSIFLNNKAESSSLIITKNVSVINITFEGKDNLLNAIYAKEEVNFKNVTYWGAQGIMNTDDASVFKSNLAAGQNITIKVYYDDVLVLETIEVTDEHGSIWFNPGYDIYFVEVIHNDDLYYSEIFNSTIAGKPDPTIIVEVQNTTVGKKALINITVNGKKNESVTIYVNGEEYFVNNGTLSYIPSEKGSYEVKVVWPGDDYYAHGVKTTSFEVLKNGLEIIIDEVLNDVYVGSPVTFTAHLNANVTGTVIFKIDYVNYNVNISNSDICRFTYTPLDIKNLTVMAIFIGNSAYLDNYSDILHLNVNKGISTFNVANSITVSYNSNKNLVVTLTNSQGKPLSNFNVNVNLKGSKNYKTDKNGQIKVPISSLVPNNYVAKITFAGDNNYKGSSANVKVIVKKASSNLIAKKKTYKAKAKSKKFSIVLKDNAGKPIKNVKVNLILKKITKKAKSKNKLKYAVKTNKKGIATFKIGLKTKCKYRAIINFAGNKYYKAITKKTVIVIK